MPIVTISRGSYSRGRDVAEGVARTLNYECIAREVLLDAKAPKARVEALSREIEGVARPMPGVKGLEVAVFPQG